jgi:cobalamin biosynthesis protein CbiG
MFMFIAAAAVILIALIGAVVVAIRRNHSQACIEARLRMCCKQANILDERLNTYCAR